MIDFIKNLRYDIFLIYAGLLLIIGITWLYVTFNPDMMSKVGDLTKQSEFMFLWIFVCWFGFYIFFKGLSEFQDNYKQDKKLQYMEREARKVELKEKLKQMGYRWN